MLVLEIDTKTLYIFEKSRFLLNKEVSILSHPFIYLLIVGRLTALNNLMTEEVRVLKMLISLLEIKESRLNVESCHK